MAKLERQHGINRATEASTWLAPHLLVLDVQPLDTRWELRCFFDWLHFFGPQDITKIGVLWSTTFLATAYDMQITLVVAFKEPTNYLDQPALAALAAGLKGFSGGVLVISHTASFVDEVRCCCLSLKGWQLLNTIRYLSNHLFNFVP
jgi:hypothetical protein